MSRMKRSVLHLARFTLQAKSALSIGSGAADGVYDHPIVRDANGLPAIPGTSLAGVLRHLWIADRDSKSADALFGYQHRGTGEASRLEVAACAIHDSHGQPVEGLLIEAAGQKRLREDALLKDALASREHPLFRDRVRIGHRGAAEKTGKFDRGILAAGHRFSGEMRLWSEHVEDPDWEALLALLADARLWCDRLYHPASTQLRPAQCGRCRCLPHLGHGACRHCRPRRHTAVRRNRIQGDHAAHQADSTRFLAHRAG